MGARKNNNTTEYTIHEIYTKKSFVKVKQAFDIGKILFAFVEMNENTKTQTKSIDCYMDVADAALLAKKILDGRMYHRMMEEKKKGAQYPNDVWSSPLGGVGEDDAKKRKLRSDGKAVSRSFGLAPGSQQFAVFTAKQQAGHTDERGLIVPEPKDKDAVYIRVAVGSYDELEKLALMIEAATKVYMSYNVSKDMKAASEWRSKSA